MILICKILNKIKFKQRKFGDFIGTFFHLFDAVLLPISMNCSVLEWFPLLSHVLHCFACHANNFARECTFCIYVALVDIVSGLHIFR